MELIINTNKKQNILIELLSASKSLAKKDFEASFSQAEKLLPELDLLLRSINKNIFNLKKIKVANKGGSFTALRIGVVTANTLAYALGISVESLSGENVEIKGIKMVKPQYSSEPNITISKKKI